MAKRFFFTGRVQLTIAIRGLPKGTKGTVLYQGLGDAPCYICNFELGDEIVCKVVPASALKDAS